MTPPPKLEKTWYENRVESEDGTMKVVDKVGLWPKQVDFMQSSARLNCFGGARGPGKSYALAMKAKGLMLAWPGIPIMIGRKDLSDLKETTMKIFYEVVPKAFYDPKWGGQQNKSENWCRFFNGSRVSFVELKDIESHKSKTLGYIGIDEGNELPKEAVTSLEPTLRWMSNVPVRTKDNICRRPECLLLGDEYVREHREHPKYQIDICTNPTPGWIKTDFYDPWKAGHERPDYKFISCSSFDNPDLPPDFIPKLLENNTAQWVQNFIYGDWTSFENMMWPTFNRATHLWRGPVPFSKFIRVEGGIDYGGVTTGAHHTCAYLTGELPTGELITFWEYSKQGAAAQDFYEKISEAAVAYRVNGWDGDSSQHRANELARKGGLEIYDTEGYKGSVKDGNNHVHRLLQPNKNTGRPQLFVADTCPKLLSGIESYEKDPVTEEPKKNQQDDQVNAWRYNVMRITRYRSHQPDREIPIVTTEPNGSRKPKPSSILTGVKKERHERMKKFVAEANRAARAG